MNLINEENARNVDLRASLSKLESDIKSFSKILQKTSSSSNARKNSDSSFEDDSEDSISDIDSSTVSLSPTKKSPIKFKDIAHAVILRRRRRKIATFKKWDGTEIDEWILSPNTDSMSRLAIISLNKETSRPSKSKKKRSSVKIEHSTSQTELQYPPVPQRGSKGHIRSLPLSYSEPDQVLNCLCSCLSGRPVLALFLLIMFNGVISMICSAIIVRIEKPAQDQRFKERDLLQNRVTEYERNLSRFISVRGFFNEDDSEYVYSILGDYEEVVAELYTYSEEIPWGILSAQSFITSIQTTTGNGDIVPRTTQGKIFTLIYATYGIPLFLWYIFKLGGLFRILVINAGYAVCRCFWLDFPEMKRKVGPGQNPPPPSSENASNSGQTKADELGASLDTRFHPSIIGAILLIFLLSVSAFISHIENISYFDSVYASFISYSTIGFGDIDIFQYSFRSNWLNFFIYGNGVHIIGYMIVSAYVTSILEKFGVRKF